MMRKSLIRFYQNYLFHNSHQEVTSNRFLYSADDITAS